MKEPKFALGQIVYLDPTGEQIRPSMGKVIGVIRWIDGTYGYVVSSGRPSSGDIVRHHVSEYELTVAREAPKSE